MTFLKRSSSQKKERKQKNYCVESSGKSNFRHNQFSLLGFLISYRSVVEINKHEDRVFTLFSLKF